MLFLQEAGSSTLTQDFTKGDVITWVIAGFAILIPAVWALVNHLQKKNQHMEAIELQKPRVELAEKQIEEMAEDKKPRLEIEAVKNEKQDRVYRLTNTGGGVARKIDIEISSSSANLLHTSAKSKLPISEIRPGASPIELMYILPSSRSARTEELSTSVFQGNLLCEDEYGNSHSFEFNIQNE